MEPSPGTIWTSVPTSVSAFKWYAGATEIAKLSGNGNLNATGTVSTPAITLGGADLQTTLTGKQDKLATTNPDLSISTSLGNNQRLLSTYDKRLKIQRYDNDGAVVTDSWMDQLSIQWNSDLNKSYVTIPDYLIVGESLTVAGESLMAYAKTSAVTTMLADKANVADPVFYGSVTTPAVTLNGADLQGLLNAKASAASPTLTGVVTADTIRASGTNTLNLVGSTGVTALSI